ncbi:MAG: hypothetical protein RR920_04220 [Lachnospiraceae bacterium]
MLKKLVVYDLKSTSRYLIPLHLFLIAITLLARFFLTPYISTAHPHPLMILLLFFFIIALGGIFLSTNFVVAIRFYKNFFTNEGYLSLTLPTTVGQHLFSKTLSGSLWIMIDTILLSSSVLFALDILSYGKTINEQVTMLFGMNVIYLFLILLLLALIGCISSVVLLYCCIAIGQLFSGHRILAALVAYFVFIILFKLITAGALFSSESFFSMIHISDPSIGITAAAPVYLAYITWCLKFSAISTFISGGLAYLTTYYLMRKKINLL